jgi:quercetin dioxygenase-like cupin family protein
MSFSVQRWTRSEAPDASELRRVLVSEGYSVFEWSDAPGTTYEPHTHDNDQSHWIISGALQLTIAGETYTLDAGDRDFVPANTTHAAFVPGKKTVRYLIGSKK